MRISRCCDRVRLPAGEAKWRRMARLAKFGGSVRVRAFNEHDQDGTRVILGSMSPGGRIITIRVNHRAEHVTGRGDAAVYDPLATFGHELGHYILKQNGREYLSVQHQRGKTNPVERACDRYSRILRART